jgi:hypothetical protein
METELDNIVSEMKSYPEIFDWEMIYFKWLRLPTTT